MVTAPQAVVDTEPPGLEVGEDVVDPGQDDMGGHGADDMVPTTWGWWVKPATPG